MITSHRDQESFKVPIMSYRNSSIYVQKMINKILRPYRHFCRIYVDNIVIFFISLEKHLSHLRFIFSTLEKMNIHLSPRKSFLDYSFIQLLNQKIDALRLATTEKKFIVIANLFFPRTLAQLKKYLNLIEYLRQYIAYYVNIIKSLQLRKTFLNKFNRSIRDNARKRATDNTYLTISTLKKLNAFHQLQKAFIAFIILHHFDDKRQLYVNLDDNKEFDYEAHIYHSSNNEKSTNSSK